MSSIRLRDGSIKVFHQTEIMGIINVTPDSFYAGSRISGVEEAVAAAGKMIAEGASVIDVGGESTRPGSEPVTAAEEIERICPAIKAIRENYPQILISADTYRAETAKAAIESGADIINDISGLTFDSEMASVCAEYDVPVIIMHTSGRPDHMQDDPYYTNVVKEVREFFAAQIKTAEDSGIAADRIIIDPGIGFGKDFDHNAELIRHTADFADLGKPILLAVSRKSFIGAATGENDPDNRLNGTVALTAFAADKGLELVRVHDVKENADAARVIAAVKGQRKTEALIALGSNIGDRRYYLERALRSIELDCGHILKRSSMHENKPYGFTDQDDFLNMVALIETDLQPDALLHRLHEIEAEMGRERLIRWGPRNIDLDIIFYGSEVILSDKLMIPHGDFRNRDFVLKPAAEIIPDFVDPVSGKNITQLLSELEER